MVKWEEMWNIMPHHFEKPAKYCQKDLKSFIKKFKLSLKSLKIEKKKIFPYISELTQWKCHCCVIQKEASVPPLSKGLPVLTQKTGEREITDFKTRVFRSSETILRSKRKG